MKELRQMVKTLNKKVKIAPYSKLSKNKLIDLINNHDAVKVIEGKNAVKLIIKSISVEGVKTEKKPKKTKEQKVFEEPPQAPKKEPEPEKEKPKKKKKFNIVDKKAPEPEKPKEKPKFMILKEEINDLLDQTKKSYQKNKSKLDQMTPLKYKNTIKKQNSKFLDDAKDIYNSLNYDFDMTSIKKVDKRFYEIIPKEKKEEPEPEKPKPKKAEKKEEPKPKKTKEVKYDGKTQGADIKILLDLFKDLNKESKQFFDKVKTPKEIDALIKSQEQTISKNITELQKKYNDKIESRLFSKIKSAIKNRRKKTQQLVDFNMEELVKN